MNKDFGSILAELLREGNDDEVTYDWLKDHFGPEAGGLTVARFRVLSSTLAEQMRAWAKDIRDGKRCLTAIVAGLEAVAKDIDPDVKP